MRLYSTLMSLTYNVQYTCMHINNIIRSYMYMYMCMYLQVGLHHHIYSLLLPGLLRHHKEVALVPLALAERLYHHKSLALLLVAPPLLPIHKSVLYLADVLHHLALLLLLLLLLAAVALAVALSAPSPNVLDVCKLSFIIPSVHNVHVIMGVF